jgi:hypothetical protein
VASYGASPHDGGLGALFESSPAPAGLHTSVAAEIAFLLGLVAVCAAPFSVTYAVALGASVAGVLFGLVGIAAASRPHLTGGVLAPLGMLFAFTALTLLGLRYLGLDTAFGDGLAPTIRDWLEQLNSHLPQP